MSFNNDIFYDNYPIREAGTTAQTKQYWLSPYEKNLAHLFYHWRHRPDGSSADSINLETPLQIVDVNGEINIAALAGSFKDFAQALNVVHELELSEDHVAAAYGLFDRRLEVMPSGSDRVLVAGLAAAAFVRAGLRVHLVGDAEYREVVLSKLLPIFDYLGISLGEVLAGDDEAKRRESYRCDVTLLSAREIAMDFLRDSVNWPKRGNRAHRVVDRLVGRRSKHKYKIMSGLPCAIHLDAQAALIDKARAPIVLTQDAHPMHEIEELQRALELATSMELAKDYIYSGKELEIAYTHEGKAKIDAWAKQFGGIWSVPSAADLMIAIALVVQNIVQIDRHYRIKNSLLEWIVADALVPGMSYYSKAFMTRVVELQQECAVTGQQEVVGRASYQHVFNRYIHLCGLSHASGYSAIEFSDVYGLKSRTTKPQRLKIDKTVFVEDQEQKLNALVERVVRLKAKELTILCVGQNEQSLQLYDALKTSSLVTQSFDDANLFSAAAHSFAFGDVILSSSIVLASVAGPVWQSMAVPIHVIVCNRSIDWYEDALLSHLIAEIKCHDGRSSQFIAKDEEVFQNHHLPVLNLLEKPLLQVGTLGENLFQFLLELRIKIIHKQVADDAFKVRRNLLTHDQGMQSMLSFSGKGLYE
ncbi:MAG: hypothetical protein ACI9WC_002233 [Arenicella sp.]|jgi:hypothetical protein